MTKTCPNCKHANPPNSKYCNQCPTELPAEEHGAGGEEYRTISVLFADLTGWTAINEQAGPEKAIEVMDVVGKEAEKIIERYGGLLNQIVGDELMVLFGFPVAHDNDPWLCARVAHDLHAMVREISRIEVEPGIDIPVRLHSGFATGTAFVRQAVDAVVDGRYRVAGDVVNTAARLAKLAHADTTLCCDVSHRRIAEFFRFEAIDDVDLKNLVGKHRVWRVGKPTDMQWRFDVATKRGLTRWVGREAELNSLLNALEDAEAGRGQCVIVTGHAGIGKTRLAHEFCQRLDSERYLALLGHCQTAGRDVAYQPLLESLKRGLGLRGELSQDELHETAVRRLLELDAGLSAYLSHLLYLFAIPSEQYPIDKSIPGETLRLEFERSLFVVLGHLCRRQPVVAIYEDWHWVDEASHAFILRLIEDMARHPMLLVILTRPHAEHVWGEGGQLSKLQLDALSRENTRDIMTAVVGVTTIPTNLTHLVYERTGGNALFIEEIARDLVESGALSVIGNEVLINRPIDDLKLPLSVQAVIQTRVCALHFLARDILMVAAVIGQTFDLEVLATVVPAPHALDAALEILLDRDLIFQETSTYPCKFRFKHVVTQQISYELPTKARRRKLHADVARALETLYQDRITEYYEQLAHHYRSAEIVEKAIEYLGYAAQRSAGLYMLVQAIEQYRAAIHLMDSISLNDEKKRKRVEFSLRMGRLASTLPSPAVYEILLKSHELALELCDQALLARVAMGLGSVSWLESRFDQAREHLAECMEVARACNDEKVEAFAWANFGQTLFYSADFVRGISILERAVEVAERLRDRPALHTACNFLALQCFYIGEFERSSGLQTMILNAAVDHRDRLMEQVVSLWSSIRLSLQGNWSDAILYCDRAIEIGDTTAAKYIEGYARCGRAYALFMGEGRCSEALADYRDALRLLDGIGHKLAMSLYQAAYAEMCALAEDCDQASEHAQLALACATRGEHLGEVMAERAMAIAEAKRATPNWGRITAHFTRSLHLAVQRRQRPDEAITRFRYGQILASGGKLAAAAEQLELANELFEAMKMDWWSGAARPLRNLVEGGLPA